MTGRALRFGSVARAYERFRPGYPEELVDEVLTYAGRSVVTALEVGAGTGKATRVFARRGIAVTATEPDPEMLVELQKHVPASVLTRCAPFEALPLTSVYDLVFAAASMHWTHADQRWSRVAAMLEPGGVFASFGGPLDLEDPALEAKVRTARADFLADDDVPSPDGTPALNPMQWPGTELVTCGMFVDVRQSVVERRMRMSARDYIGHLSTISAYLELLPPVRTTVLSRVMEVLPAQVSLVGDITLHLARRGARSRRE